jgi:hypothetical protein
MALGLVACGAAQDNGVSDSAGAADPGAVSPSGGSGGGQGGSLGTGGTPGGTGGGVVQGGAGSTSKGGSGGASSTGASGSAGAGGTAGSGGSGGSAGSVPHGVGKCDGLGAKGQWENVTPPGVMLSPPFTGVLITLADPQQAGTVYATTAKSGVFKSSDCGASWKKVDTGRNADKLDSGLIWSAVIDPTSSSTLYALTGYGPAGLWKTTNGGVDWDQIMPMDKGMPGFVARVNMDPTNSKHLIINFHDNCTGGHTPVCFGETQDGGTTWKVLDFPTSLKSGWGEGTAVMPIDATHWIYSNWELYYTSDSGSNWKDVTPLAATDVSFFRASNGKSYLGAAGGVSVTTDGATWSVIPNSGHGLDIVVGSSTQLFAIAGFGPPNPASDFIWSANLSDPTKWTLMATPGLPKLAAGSNGADYDADHHVLYVAIQGEGMWRVVTQ